MIEMSLEANLWLRTAAFAPWNLCVLTEAQSHLTLERRWRARSDAAMKMESPFNQKPLWLSFSAIAMQDPASEDIIVYPPPSALDLACRMQGTIGGGIIDISEAFPLTPDQKLADHRNDLVAQAKLLQSAQLRIALLLNPSLGSTILEQFERPAPHADATTEPGIITDKPR
jgi:hypothetical protein